ncbi:MAG TPA: DNA-formamidopyrimidine glycosylase family protein [Steroidobacteraceae bacterium]|nr:DNA-formamidopyrimidine glycosylase family protein [Steroidobacteraceae bacterium]
MPELPDITLYLEALGDRIVGQQLKGVTLIHPFLLRTATPPLASVAGRRVEQLRRVGKRIAIGLAGQLWLVLHLMIAGRLHWYASGQKVSGRSALARFEFDSGTLTLTEAGSKRRASLYLLAGDAELERIDPGGLDVFAADLAAFSGRLNLEHHTLKRALTDPRLFSGIGNAYSDEILHRARLSPLAMTHKLRDEEIARLYAAARDTLEQWTVRLRAAGGAGFPEGVTAFRPGMAVHGRHGQPCPACGTPVQRIRYADNETNYCPRCQTEGRVLADRALSRLLKDDWPRTADELERLHATPRS